MEKEKKKTAIIVSGGGMRCSYSAGVLAALAKKYNFTQPDIAIGGSGSAGNLAYYLSGQYDYLKRIWTSQLSSPKFINFLRIWKVMDIDYLINEILKEKFKLNVDKVRAAKTQMLIPATEAETGKVEYFYDSDPKVDLFEVLRATKAMPIAYNRKVKIGDKFYFDSPISSAVTFNILKAIEMGAKKILVIDTGNLLISTRILLKLWVGGRSKNFRKNYKNFILLRNRFNIPEQIELFHLAPKKKGLGGTVLTKNPKFVKRSFKRGYLDTVKNRKLGQFLASVV
jgi:predicted patatin/cPLA2 family phospholipase